MIRRALVPALLCLAALGLGGATCAEPPVSPDPEQPEDDCFRNGAGDCVVSTPGCAPGEISSEGRETCATCEIGGQIEQICGERELATCFPVEGPGGDCQVCETERGERVFSDCLDTQVGGDLDCAEVLREQASGAPLSCELCRDASGRLVSETCRNDEACELSPPDEQGCRECRNDAGELVRRECAPVEVDPPRVCQVYADDTGRCVDCFGEQDQLLLHECVLGGPQPTPIACDTFFIGDTRCERCFDDRGGLVSEQCEPVSGSYRCERVDSPWETCLICLDEAGREQRSECELLPCGPDGVCASCEAAQLADGTPCRACTLDDGTIERVCAGGGEISCVNEEQVIDAEPDPNAPALVSTCVVCSDPAGDELYRQCEDPRPPVCEQAEDPLTGERCDRCLAPGEVEFTSCANAPGVCVEVNEIPLQDANGVTLTLRDLEGEVPAIVDCTSCAGGLDRCETRTACAAGQCSEALAELRRDATACDPWGLLGGAEPLAGLMSLLIREAEAPVYTAEHSPVDASCVENDCTCAVGEIRIVVPQAQAPRFVNTFGFSF